ncbi:hypothetical protein GBF38_008597 [Nibea albiflora]|uniref:Uncharacterized protein n=1 Tax=Nibea albiflora TaxID=240163 RepID=A0ACB7EQU2_NIBAL|nr:hypothetical protein GBF38_008597 [Nibea albiflora]
MTPGEPNRPVGNQNGTQERLNGHTVNQVTPWQSKWSTRDTKWSRKQRPFKDWCEASGASDSPKVRASIGVGLLPGTPVATVDRGTAFLTGVLVSSSAGCDGGGGLVFTKLSRYLGWMRPKLEAFEDHMTTHQPVS